MSLTIEPYVAQHSPIACVTCQNTDDEDKVLVSCGSESQSPLVLHRRCMQSYCGVGPVFLGRLSVDRLRDLVWFAHRVDVAHQTVAAALESAFPLNLISSTIDNLVHMRHADERARDASPVAKRRRRCTSVRFSIEEHGADQCRSACAGCWLVEGGAALDLVERHHGSAKIKTFHRNCLMTFLRDDSSDGLSLWTHRLLDHYSSTSCTHLDADEVHEELKKTFPREDVRPAADGAPATAPRDGGVAVGCPSAEPRGGFCAHCEQRFGGKVPCVDFTVSPRGASAWFHDECLREASESRGVLHVHSLIDGRLGAGHVSVNRIDEVLRLRYVRPYDGTCGRVDATTFAAINNKT